MKTKLLGFILLLVAACVDPFEIRNVESTNMLVVEGFVSSELKQHQILLSRSTTLVDERFIPEDNATIILSDQNGVKILLAEKAPGIYETPEFAAQAGSTYTLEIETAMGKMYSSRAVAFQDGPDIGDVYAKYINNPNGAGKGVQIYTNTEDPSGQAHFFRWNYTETYEVHAPFPSNWVWLGGSDVTFRTDGIDRCYVSDTLRNILIRSTQGQELDKIIAQPIRYIPDDSYILRHRYSILVQQFCLSEESYLYWDNLRMISEKQGSLSDIQPGSLSGNIFSVANPDETVLGYFDVGKVSEKRIFTSAIKFYDEGLKMPQAFRNNCYEIAPILVPESQLADAMTKYERTMYIWEVYGMSPGATFQLMPKSCCDCRDQGPTERPPFF
jgi:hypothetical protein